MAESAKTTFVVTNNHFEAKGIVNALQLINLLTGNKVRVPETLRIHYPQLEANPRISPPQNQLCSPWLRDKQKLRPLRAGETNLAAQRDGHNREDGNRYFLKRSSNALRASLGRPGFGRRRRGAGVGHR